MPKISIEKSSALDAKETFARIKTFLTDDRDLRKLDSNYQCQFDDSKLSGTAKGKQFEALMTINNANGETLVRLDISLPLLLSPFKGFVEKTLRQKLDTVLG